MSSVNLLFASIPCFPYHGKTCNLVAKIIKNTILCKFLISYFSFYDKKLVFLGIFD
nr:MAG TPA_asm: hypothetical protein [Caudoviricetes sp.]